MVFGIIMGTGVGGGLVLMAMYGQANMGLEVSGAIIF
jgi:hypothetical protein